MLATLSIENFAIIEHLHIDFTEGMTVLSGETGAGKSIIIDALGILCGGRGSADYIREGSEKLVIEGLFTFGNVHPDIVSVLNDFGIDINLSQEDLILHREINLQGKNIIRINGQLANVSLLKQLGYYLVDIHGQNEHQALLDSSQHILLLNQYGGDEFASLSNEYRQSYRDYNQLRQDWLAAQQDESDQMQRLSFIEFQAEELEQANLVEGEEAELEQISKKLQNQQHIIENINSVNQLMSELDTSILNQVDQVLQLLEEIQMYDESYPSIIDQLTSTRFELEDISQQVAFSSNVNLDTEDTNIDEVEGRLSELSRLKRKYGMTVDELMTYYNDISEEIYQIKNREQYLATLENQLQTAYQKAKRLADQLHTMREAIAQELVVAIETQLQDLYMANSRFEVKFDQPPADSQLNRLLEDNSTSYIKLSEEGYDQLEFFVATNLGESLKPLVRVASGGELSRYMLALKTVFSSRQLPKVMVFDEIDTGVSGRVAQAIAIKIRQIANLHQVLCITHLPQVAAIAEQQLYIHKEVIDERTTTRIKNLTPEERSEIIAYMMSGETITPASLKLAEELLNDYQEI